MTGSTQQRFGVDAHGLSDYAAAYPLVVKLPTCILVDCGETLCSASRPTIGRYLREGEAFFSMPLQCRLVPP